MKFKILLLLLIISNFCYGIETKVTVRAKAKDAKFIGSSIGGAYIIIRNKLTNEILAQGKTEGSTGNTDLIMKTPLERGKSICDENTSKFLATVDIDEPTFVVIEVVSPINKKQATVNVKTELWLIPGKHILGDGIIIEIPGFIIDILEPHTHKYISLTSVKDKPFKLRANIVMMCGCGISKGGLWDANKIEVKAIIKKDGKKLTEVSLQSVSTNLFEGEFSLTESGQYEATIYVFDENTGNTGVDKVNYVIYN